MKLRFLALSLSLGLPFLAPTVVSAQQGCRIIRIGNYQTNTCQNSITTIEAIDLIKIESTATRLKPADYILSIKGDGKVNGKLSERFQYDDDVIITLENARLSEEFDKPSRFSLFFREIGISSISVDEDKSTNTISIRLRTKKKNGNYLVTRETGDWYIRQHQEYFNSINLRNDFYVTISSH